MAKETKAVAPVKENANLPAEFMGEIESDAGLGSENSTTEDMLLPFLKIAQALSPEVNKRESTHITGLEVGDFFNTATQTVYGGEAGFHYIPVFYRRSYLEWTPRDAGGGFNGEHDQSILDKCKAGDKGEQILPNGNEIVTTGIWYGIAVDADGNMEQCVLSLSKTQLKKSRGLMTKLKTLSIKGPSGKPFNPPLFFSKVKVTTVPESNDQGNWMGWKFELDGNVFELAEGRELYEQCKSLHEAVRSGAVKASAPDSQTDIGRNDVDDEDDSPASRQGDKEIPF